MKKSEAANYVHVYTVSKSFQTVVSRFCTDTLAITPKVILDSKPFCREVGKLILAEARRVLKAGKK